MGASVVVNKIPYDFASLEVTIEANGEVFGIIEGLEEIEYTTTIDREVFYGAGRIPAIRTTGRAEYDGSITIHRYWYNYIVQKAKSLGIPLATLSMTVAVAYIDPATDDVVTDTLTRVALAEIENSHASGVDHLLVPLPLSILNIFYDGVDVFGNTL